MKMQKIVISKMTFEDLDGVYEIDKDAFIVISNAREVFGEGFKEE